MAIPTFLQHKQQQTPWKIFETGAEQKDEEEVKL